MSISSLFGGGRDDEPAPPRAIISPLKNGFLLDPDTGGRGLSESTACATPEDLAAAVLAWAQDLSKPKSAAKVVVKARPTRKH